MDVLEAIRLRRSVRDHKPDDVPDAILSKLIEAACWAPSATNEQPWTFTVIRNKEVLDTVSNEPNAHLRKSGGATLPERPGQTADRSGLPGLLQCPGAHCHLDGYADTMGDRGLRTCSANLMLLDWHGAGVAELARGTQTSRCASGPQSCGSDHRRIPKYDVFGCSAPGAADYLAAVEGSSCACGGGALKIQVHPPDRQFPSARSNTVQCNKLFSSLWNTISAE